MDDITKAVLLSIKDKGETSLEMRFLSTIILSLGETVEMLEKKVATYEKVLIERRSMPLTQEEIEEIQKLRLIYNKALPKHGNDKH